MSTLMFDPPSGWLYGFPKPVPERVERALGNKAWKEWLADEGYPIEDIPFALKHSRYWRIDAETESSTT